LPRKIISLPGQPDPALVHKRILVQQVCLTLVALIALTEFTAWLYPPVAYHLPLVFRLMGIPMALAAFLSVFSLVLSQPGSQISFAGLSRLPAIAAGLIAAAVMFKDDLGISDLIGTLRPEVPVSGELPSQAPAAFLLLVCVMVLVVSTSDLLRRVTDILVYALCVVVLTLLIEVCFEELGVFGLSTTDVGSLPALACLALLTAAVTLRQADQGVLSILWGNGIGSRIARGFAPFLVLAPLVVEMARSQIALRSLVPHRYGNALLTALAAAALNLLLLVLAWRISGMEAEIHDLTLRDDLTGLYNMRGFYLLGEQTLRLAQRAQLPFSVLFIDLDGLKQINDHLGHNTGSKYLVETGELLTATFRDTDVKGRFGGDEFVVAGQFSLCGIELATARLQASAAERNASAPRRFPLSLSVGYVTVDTYSEETLKDLVTAADEKMYQDKRRKKMQRQ
jgi:diguanylate cyclase (GGDEF)-like protein